MGTKFGGGHPRGQSATLDKNPRILSYDCHGTDESDRGVPRRIVTLAHGWAFQDAAVNEGDDPEVRMALHHKSFGSVSDAERAVQQANPCKCGRCLETFGGSR
jgi:hypothetical protein